MQSNFTNHDYRVIFLFSVKSLEDTSGQGRSMMLQVIDWCCLHAIRSQSSCEPQLVQFYHDMASSLDCAQHCGHKQTGVIIMEFTTAFDNVPHRRPFCISD